MMARTSCRVSNLESATRQARRFHNWRNLDLCAIAVTPFGRPSRYFPTRYTLQRQRLIYTDTGKQVGDVDHLKVFASEDAAERWFAENDPEGVAFEYEVVE
jgi:hypothetical protein